MFSSENMLEFHILSMQQSLLSQIYNILIFVDGEKWKYEIFSTGFVTKILWCIGADFRFEVPGQS